MPIARKESIQWLPGNFYHIYNRGARQKSIFQEETNYLYVLGKMGKYCKAFDLTLIAYCLMPTHYHFLIRQNDEKPAGLLPQRIFNSYSKAYNKRYQSSGTLFEHRYQAKIIPNEKYLLHLCRYIHANPVKDGIVGRLEDWPYSNYLEWIGARKGKLFDREFVDTYSETPEDYSSFVLDYLLSRYLPEEIRIYLENLEK
jgi:REP element-mobilizing transposase RayT